MGVGSRVDPPDDGGGAGILVRGDLAGFDEAAFGVFLFVVLCCLVVWSGLFFAVWSGLIGGVDGVWGFDEAAFLLCGVVMIETLCVRSVYHGGQMGRPPLPSTGKGGGGRVCDSSGPSMHTHATIK